MIEETVEAKAEQWVKELDRRDSDKIFSEVPIPLDDFLYGDNYLNIVKLSPTQYDFIKHGTQIYRDKELKELGWEKTRQVQELVAWWGKGCFLGDTKITLADGAEKTFEELVNEYKGKSFWVYSYGGTDGIVRGLASNPRITKTVTQLIEIELDNGKTIKCTPDHLFLKKDGEYTKAIDLTINQSLLSLRKGCKVESLKIITLDKPVPVYDITVEKYHNFALSSGVFVHNSGKDFVSQVIQCRVAYLLGCLNNPQRYFNLNDAAQIDMLNMAYSADQAEWVFFNTFAEMIRRCKWFNNKCKIKNRMIEFKNRVYAHSGNSYEEAFEGKNLIIAVLDEISAFKTKLEVEQMSLRRMRAPKYSAEAVYDMAKSSIESRFGVLGKLVSLSFSRFKNDYIEQLYVSGKDEPTCFVSFGKTWEVNPYKKEEDFAIEFRRNPERAESRYACNPSSIEGGYFRDKAKISKAFPIIPKEQVPTTDACFPELKDFFKCQHNSICSVHIDLGVKRDSAGFCMSHVEKTITEIRKNPEGERIEVTLPIVKIDLLTSFIVPLNGEIDFSKIRDLIMDLINRKFTIGIVTFDQFQSVDSRQIIEKMGIETDTRSVDRNTEAYDSLKELVYDDRLIGYSYIRNIDTGTGKVVQMNEIINELSNLILIGGKKVDHPDYGAKDIADSCAGSVQGAIELGFSDIKAGDIQMGKDRETVVMAGSRFENDREFLTRTSDDYFAG